ncbi:unnamed protein product [Peniophora sp. CBMAI 1063]|nr:unnamed protein product [Peniophora sp. CBMAI 1063]
MAGGAAQYSQQQIIKPVHPLGRPLRVCIKIEGCKGPFPIGCTSQNPGNSYRVHFCCITINYAWHHIYSAPAPEGDEDLLGSVRWDDILYLDDCFEQSHIGIYLVHDDSFGQSGYPSFTEANPWVCMSMDKFLSTTEVVLWPHSDKLQTGAHHYLLRFSAFRVHDKEHSGDRTYIQRLIPDCISESDELPLGPKLSAGSWDTIVSRSTKFVQKLQGLQIQSVHGLWMQADCWSLCQSFFETRGGVNENVDRMLLILMRAMYAIDQIPEVYLEQRRGDLSDILDEMHASMQNIVRVARYNIRYQPQREQAVSRLTIIIATPGPTSGPSSTSATANEAIITKTMAKDILLLALEALASSADAFPPLKSAVGGLLFLIEHADQAAGNRKQIREIYGRVNALITALKPVSVKGSPIVSEHLDAFDVLSRAIVLLQEDLGSIVRERKNRFKRYFSARRHRSELQDVIVQLETASTRYTTAVTTITAMTTARILVHVETLTRDKGISPLPKLEMTRTDAIMFPPEMSRIEEV